MTADAPGAEDPAADAPGAAAPGAEGPAADAPGAAAPGAEVRVRLPAHLRLIARVDGEVTLLVSGAVTQAALLDALEARYPTLRGTIRDRATHQRRPFVRFFACEEDLSHDPPDTPLPEPVAAGREPLLIVGAMAGG